MKPPKKIPAPAWHHPFKNQKYQVEFSEECAAAMAGMIEARPWLAQAVIKRAEMLSVFPPDSRFWTPPQLSFEGGSPHHAMVEVDNMAVEITAHYRLDGRCVVVYLSRPGRKQ
jgi:hypothetical protein